ncbi:death ligand signal enhancer isoform 2-T2 [Menidia menidia]
MLRVQGFVGRVLHRYLGNNTLRLSQNHHVEDEVITGSAALSSSRQSSDSSSHREEDGERRRKQRTFQFAYAEELPRYSALDAVGWGAVAVLFMQICKRIHSRFSSSTEPSPSPGTLTAPSALQKCGYRSLLEILSRRDVLPRGRSVLCMQRVPDKQNGDQSSDQSSSSTNDLSSGNEQHHLSSDCSISDHRGEPLIQDSLQREDSVDPFCPLQEATGQVNTEKNQEVKNLPSNEKRLAEAAINLRQVGDTSVSVILNIMGLENAKCGNYVEAFTCFRAAAQHGYSKAQFNTGVCYEKGRGVCKDEEKALYYYRQAAASGHRQAQYRYAKLLLTSRGHQSRQELETIINLLEEASSAGLTKAQICLASVYCRDPARHGCRSVHCLKMAAELGDHTAMLLLGQCYESGFGVQQNLKIAVEFYKQAAQAGNKRAKSLLTPTNEAYRKEDAVMRSIRSAPCFPVTERGPQQPQHTLACHRPATLPLLPHSWSTGSLCSPPALSALPLHLHPTGSQAGACQWTVGIG